MKKIDKLIHEPARLLIVSHLYIKETADMLSIQEKTGLSWGNISSHMQKLEKAGYIRVIKGIVDKKQHTMLKLTFDGREKFEEYKKQMKEVLE